MIIKLVVIALAGYLLGNIQTGVLVSKSIGNFDIRHKGSKSAGTTNVLRTMGWVPSVITLLGDVLKGALGSLIGLWLMGEWGARLGGLMAVIGHNWPVLFGFKGGKGIATSLGLILVTDPIIGVMLPVCQAIVVKLTHTMSIASIVSATFYLIASVIAHFGAWNYIAFAVIIWVFAVYTHRENLVRIRDKKEHKLDFEEINEISKKKNQGG